MQGGKGVLSVDRRDVNKVWALIVVCVGSLMTIWDYAAVAVILPPIHSELGFSEVGLAWIVNAYFIAFAGFLLFSGCLGDVIGCRRMYLAGSGLFAIASMGCALSQTSSQLILSRVLEGLGSAALSTSGTALIVNLFEHQDERARAFGINVFASSGGSIVGALVSGILTSALGWRSIFVTNVVIGCGLFVSGMIVLPRLSPSKPLRTLDAPGAIVMTTLVALSVYLIMDSRANGAFSQRSLYLLSGIVATIWLFAVVERKAKFPLIPPSVIADKTLMTCSVGTALCAAGASSQILVSLYLQRVVGFEPIMVGLLFLPSSLVTAASSLGLSWRLVKWFGIKWPLVAALLVIAAGIGLLSGGPKEGNVSIVVLPALVMLGFGAGIAYSLLSIGGLRDVSKTVAGVASGVMGTISVVGRALGFSILATAAAARSQVLSIKGSEYGESLNAGYHLAFIIGAIFVLAAAAVVVIFLRRGSEGGQSRVPLG